MTLENSTSSGIITFPEKRLSAISEEIEGVIVKITQERTETRTQDIIDAEDTTEPLPESQIKSSPHKREIHNDIEEESSQESPENCSSFSTFDIGDSRANSVQTSFTSEKIGKTIIGMILVAGIGSFLYLEMNNKENFDDYKKIIFQGLLSPKVTVYR